MTWTYTGAPSNSSTQGQIDALRLMLGLTSSSAPVSLQDEELGFYLTAAGNMYAAAAHAADVVGGRYGGLATQKTVGDLSLSYGDRGAEYRALAVGFRRQASLRSVPYAGGISIADKCAHVIDSDRVKPEFARDMDDNRRQGWALGSTGPNG